jgi:hypothetical protein
MTKTNVSAEQFWNLYFANRFVNLQRTPTGCLGTARLDAGAGLPAALLREPELADVAISRQTLEGYGYEGDLRFALAARRPTSVRSVLSSIAAGDYVYREPAPYGRDRMAELAGQLLPRVATAENDDPSALAQIVTSLLVDHDPALDQVLAAMVWVLGEFRRAEVSPALIQVVRNSTYVAYSRVQVHFTVVSAAMTALWKSNNKTLIKDYLALMADASASGRYMMAALLERLYSPEQLWSLHLLGSGYEQPDQWARRLAFGLDYTQQDWDIYDAGSVLWENRLSAASRLAQGERTWPARRLLQGDEVKTVSRVAALT